MPKYRVWMDPNAHFPDGSYWYNQDSIEDTAEVFETEDMTEAENTKEYAQTSFPSNNYTVVVD